MLLPAFETIAQAIRRLRRVQEQRIGVEVLQGNRHQRLGHLHRGVDVFDIPSAHHELVVRDGRQVFGQQLHLLVGETVHSLLAAGKRFFVSAGIEHGLLRGEHEQFRVGKLLVQKLDRRAKCCFLRLFPIGAVVAKKVRGRVKTDLVAVLMGQHLRLTDVAVVLRLQATGRTGKLGDVELLRRDIVCCRCDDRFKLPGTAPDLHELVIVQRRIALGGLVQKDLVRGVVPAVALDHATGETAHGAVAAAFLNNVSAVAALVHPGVEVLLFKEGVERLDSGEELRPRIGSPVKEPCGVESVCVDEGKERRDLALHGTVGIRVLGLLNLQKSMELRPGGLAVLLFEMIAAVVDADRHIGKRHPQVLRRHPIIRVFGVIVIKLDREAVAPQKVRLAAIAVFILGADVIVTDGLRQ